MGLSPLIFEPHSRLVDKGFSNACVRRAEAMTTGFIDRQKLGKVVRQVLVVVTMVWTVICFDSNMKNTGKII